MGFGKRVVKFTGGGLLGAAIGAGIGLLVAPDSGPGLQRSLRERIASARLAGAEAKAAKEEELIRKFRAGVEDPEALLDAQAQSQVERSEAVMALGLGLNAPGAITAQQTVPAPGGEPLPDRAP